MSERNKTSVLTIRCPDKTGIAAAVFGFLKEKDGFIIEAAQYGDPFSKLFFMRIVFTTSPETASRVEIREAFEKGIAAQFNMDWELHDGDKPLKIIVAVSKFGHCLNDLLHRYSTGSLPVEIAAVVSNHQDMRSLVEWHGIPYHYFRMPKGADKKTKRNQENKILSLIDELGAELLVLARYMQILSPEMCEALDGRCINIHHSFLPSFVGAKPYHQAHEKGVKIIGATSHYVTKNLDQGPIIEQAVERVDHTNTPDNLVSIGRDLENVVLAKAVRYHAQHRVLLNGNKTIVFK